MLQFHNFEVNIICISLIGEVVFRKYSNIILHFALLVGMLGVFDIGVYVISWKVCLLFEVENNFFISHVTSDAAISFIIMFQNSGLMLTCFYIQDLFLPCL